MEQVFFGLWLVLMCSTGPIAFVAADAPPGRYTVNTDGTVYDVRTKLTWQQMVTATAYTQPSAVSYCAGLTPANGGWRLPTVSELLTLVDPTRYAPAIDSTAFPNIPTGNQLFFWSSSAYVGTAGSAWGVSFSAGYSNYTATTTAFNVRCVR